VSLVDALGALRSLDAPAFTTREAATRLRVPDAHASVALARLQAAALLIRLRRGLWAFRDRIDPLALPELLTAPFPAYVSLQSALYLHGMISQVPAVTYAVTLARTRRFTTPLGTVSVHHVQPGLFFGYEDAGRAGGRLATPEKALVDYLYLTPARSGLFRALPELEWPKTFRKSVARSIVRRIRSPSRRRSVSHALEELLSGRRGR
jgi:predicted transcriptional regulator of viral defense system